MTYRLDRLDDEALRERAAPFLAGLTAGGLRVDVASGVDALDDVAAGLRRARFKSGRRALYRSASSRMEVDDLDAQELATAVAEEAGLPVAEVYRASDSELYTALPDGDLLLGVDLPDLDADELRALLDRFAAPVPEVAEGDLAGWAQAALLDRTAAGRKLRAVDAIIGTVARHPGEWAIDGNQLRPLGFPGAWRSAPALLDGSDVDFLRAAVEPLRPRFEQRGRGPWYTQTTQMLGRP